MPPPEIRNRIADLRKELGATQEDLAAALGVSRQTVISIERGRYNPSLPLVFQLAGYFGRPIEEVFYAVSNAPLADDRRA